MKFKWILFFFFTYLPQIIAITLSIRCSIKVTCNGVIVGLCRILFGTAFVVSVPWLMFVLLSTEHPS